MVAMFALGLMVALTLQLIIAAGAPGMAEGPSIGPATSGEPDTGVPEYRYRVYTLNVTTKSVRDNGTFFSFRTGDLPFDLSSIRFGDFRTDPLYNQTYYGGSGILANANGTGAIITLKEGNGKTIDTIAYHGQNLIVFDGETRTTSYPNGTTSRSGTDAMIQDWREGAWSPADGIIIGHPGNVSISNSSLFIIVYEPTGGLHLPEFEVLPIVVAAIVLILFLGRRRRCRQFATQLE